MDDIYSFRYYLLKVRSLQGNLRPRFDVLTEQWNSRKAENQNSNLEKS